MISYKILPPMTLALLLFVGWANTSSPSAKPTATPQPQQLGGLLIFAPHPDDETFCCSFIIQQALAEGKRVRVVIFTNGDGWPDSAADLLDKPEDSLTPEDFLELARARQIEAVKATGKLGLRPEDVIFLGYPDSGLDKVYATEGETPYQQQFTKKTETYGFSQTDYHTRTHGEPAPYTRAAVLSDVVGIIQDFQPDEIYVSSGYENHLDHAAAFWFVRDAVLETGYSGSLTNYVLHTDSLNCPEGLPCPAPVIVSPTDEQAAKKLEALLAYQSQIWLIMANQTYLERYVNDEERFWPVEELSPDSQS